MMDGPRVETRRAFELVRQRIITLALAPGSAVNDQRLATELELPLAPVQEALKLLAHEHLVRIHPRYGAYVADVNASDLGQLSELRVELEGLAAALAARRATRDDLAVLDPIGREQISADDADPRRLFDRDHRFHVAVAAAARSEYLAQSLERFFGQSLRLWYLVLPQLDFLAGAVHKHVDLTGAIRAGDAEAAEEIMREHVRGFYGQVRALLEARDNTGPPRSDRRGKGSGDR
jgi:DNA-binding GntR family transcriptional regulator